MRHLASKLRLLRSRPFVTYVLKTVFYNDNVNFTFATGKDAKNASVVTTVIGGCESIDLKHVVVFYSVVVVTSDCFILRSLRGIICKCIALFIAKCVVSRIIGDSHRSIRFFVVSDGCRRVNERVGTLRENIAIVSKAKLCAKGRIGVVFILTGGDRSGAVFRVVGSVSPETFISRDTIVNMCKRKFSRFGIGGGAG